MDDSLSAVLARARERVTPNDDERRALEAVADALVERARQAIEERGIDADVVLAGSTARGTWLPGERDVDVFVRFPPDVERSALREHGLAIGHDVLENGTEEYAEHPYVSGPLAVGADDAGAVDAPTAAIDSVDVDVVPCYDVETAAQIRSAVDRTPFHTEYVREGLEGDLATDVRLAKSFATAAGIYGSDLRTRGFSGYLLELLILEYGGFLALLRAVADWTVPVVLDPAGHGEASFADPLVVVDPTDPRRNVAAVCSADNVARFQHHARAFLDAPSISSFATVEEAQESDETAVGETTDAGLDADDLLAHVERRGTTPIAVTIPAPKIVEDDLYPQLRTSLSGIVGLLEREGFDVLRSSSAVADGTALLLLELAVTTRPNVERHEGPPVHVRKHAERFLESYEDRTDVYGPFIEEGRYVVERERRATTARALLESEALFEVQHGVAIERALRDGFDLLAGEELTDLLPTFAPALGRHFDPGP